MRTIIPPPSQHRRRVESWERDHGRGLSERDRAIGSLSKQLDDAESAAGAAEERAATLEERCRRGGTAQGQVPPGFR